MFFVEADWDRKICHTRICEPFFVRSFPFWERNPTYSHVYSELLSGFIEIVVRLTFFSITLLYSKQRFNPPPPAAARLGGGEQKQHKKACIEMRQNQIWNSIEREEQSRLKLFRSEKLSSSCRSSNSPLPEFSFFASSHPALGNDDNNQPSTLRCLFAPTSNAAKHSISNAAALRFFVNETLYIFRHHPALKSNLIFCRLCQLEVSASSLSLQ